MSKDSKCPCLSCSNLWKGTTNFCRCYIWSWETPSHTTTYYHIYTILNSKYYVSQMDCCFQCQESGHIAHHCPSVWCFKCDEYRHIVMDCLHRIPPSGTPAHHHRLQSQHRHHHRSTSCHCHKYRYRCSRSRSHSHHQRYCSQNCHDFYRGCSRSHHRNKKQQHKSNSWHPHSITYTHHSHHGTPHYRSSLLDTKIIFGIDVQKKFSIS